jgi:hypothetical protein
MLSLKRPGVITQRPLNYHSVLYNLVCFIGVHTTTINSLCPPKYQANGAARRLDIRSQDTFIVCSNCEVLFGRQFDSPERFFFR